MHNHMEFNYHIKIHKKKPSCATCATFMVVLVVLEVPKEVCMTYVLFKLITMVLKSWVGFSLSSSAYNNIPPTCAIICKIAH